jgi:RNA polymerase sigma-70 factor (ECF subfamily)
MPDWQEILARDGRAAWQAAYRLVGNQADADDCFQEACLAALQVSGREIVHNWRGLLQRLATVRAIDHLRVRNRASRRQPGQHWDELPDASPAPFQNAQDAELASELRLALCQIPPRQAEAFCLHCIEDWSYEEIARHARMSVTAVGVLLNRARKRLRGLLARFREDAAMPVQDIDRGGYRQATTNVRKELS